MLALCGGDATNYNILNLATGTDRLCFFFEKERKVQTDSGSMTKKKI